MRKYIFIMFLSLTLGVSSLAMGNDYSFTKLYWNSVFQNSSYLAVNSSGSTSGANGSVNVSSLQLDGVIYSNVASGESLSVTYSNNTVVNKSRINFYLPVNFVIAPGQTYTGTYVFNIVPGSYDYSSYNNFEFGATFTGGGSGTVTKTYYEDLDLVTVNYVNGVPNGVTVLADGQGYLLDVSYTNNTTSSITISTINFVILNQQQTFTNVNFGVLSSDDSTVLLPSYVEEQLSKIAFTVQDHTFYLGSMYNDLRSLLNTQQLTSENVTEIVSLLDQLLDSMSSSGAAQSNITNIVNNIQQVLNEPSVEATEEASRIEATLEEAKEVLQKNQVILQSVVLPSADDLVEVVPIEVNTSISDSLDDQSLKSIFDFIFEFEFVLIMLMTTFTIGTVGYIFFGKR